MANESVARKESLKKALFLAETGKRRGLRALDGKPAGGWPETQQARRDTREALPLQSQRAYTVDEFVSAFYTLDSADRYRARIEAA